ncbi:UNVERIFIED_ORG: hypothetical protein LHK14_03770 [Roseateles sp. XES5]|nr:WcbI family polysaccharide biosynthesis putative acetyltransferase [Roseateles sp. XES5]
MRIGIIGNCQVETIAPVLRLLTRSLDIESHHSWNIKSNFNNQESLEEYINGFDIFLCQDFYGIDGFDSSAIWENTKAIRFPTFYFDAFHPDCVYLYNHEKQTVVRTDMSHYNSGLIAYLYVNGLTESETVNAFRANIFSAAGFLNRWHPAYTVLEQEFKACNLRLADFMPRWMRQGPFMHSCNHPTLNAIYDVCLFVLQQAGATTTNVERPGNFLQDPLLRYPVWPIYPEISSRYGFSGTYCFKGENLDGTLKNLFDLPQFVERSFHYYAENELTKIDDPMFVKWDNDGLIATIRAT